MRSLSDEQLVDLVAMLPEVDSVELKLTVPESDQRSTLKQLDLDPLDAHIRQVFFFDTPDLALNRHGLVLRARRIQGRSNDSTVKLRPVEPETLSADMRAMPELGVEIDTMPGGYVCSASMGGALGTTEVRAVAKGDAPIKSLFTKPQKTYFKDHAPEGLKFGDLAVLGPITVLKLRFAPPDLGRKVVAELWFYPDGSRILELSTKCLPADAFSAAAEARVFLSRNGISLTGEQQTKTSTALAYFSAQLAAAPA